MLELQWTRATPSGWEIIIPRDFAGLPRAPLPVDDQLGGLNDARGYCHRLACQGIGFTADHYHAEPLTGGGCRVVAWCDREPEYPDGYKHARVVDFPLLAPDPTLGGAYNTRIRQTVYAQDAIRQQFLASGPIRMTGGGVVFRPWDEFQPPPNPLHGILTSSVLNDVHEALIVVPGTLSWRRAIEGLPLEEVIDGELRDQRPLGRYKRPRGTFTYGLRDITQTGTVHAAGEELQMTRDAFGAGELVVENVQSGNEEFVYMWTTVAGEPGEKTWPHGNYRVSLDVTAVGADITFGFRSVGTLIGHLVTINADLASHSIGPAITQTESLSGSTGIQISTCVNTGFNSAPITDRMEATLAAVRVANMGTQGMEIRMSADCFLDGPWGNDHFIRTTLRERSRRLFY